MLQVQLENYVRYVSTREGVEKVEGSRDSLSSAAQQKERPDPLSDYP
ncbi:MAG: hypothetical protein HDR14_10220 [Lachnospiraceae bacterium]|nr:hypothetical protein [Lachnospiraceae bacterium]